MKKSLPILLCLALLFSASACGSPGAVGSTPAPVPAEASSPAPSAAASVPSSAEAPSEASRSAGPDAVDVDLTQLSSTMVYSEVYAMMYEPAKYIDKTVKMRGAFATQEYNGTRLYACIVQDATACCAQGLEFEPAEKLTYPADYPVPGAEITVIGTFDTYREEQDGNSYVYIVLRNARFV